MKVVSITKNQFGKWMLCYTIDEQWKVENFKTYDQLQQFLSNNAIIKPYCSEIEEWQQLPSDAKSRSVLY
jgi:hypothetical protein